jgi:hypothetical protein
VPLLIDFLSAFGVDFGFWILDLRFWAANSAASGLRQIASTAPFRHADPSGTLTLQVRSYSAQDFRLAGSGWQSSAKHPIQKHQTIKNIQNIKSVSISFRLSK